MTDSGCFMKCSPSSLLCDLEDTVLFYFFVKIIMQNGLPENGMPKQLIFSWTAPNNGNLSNLKIFDFHRITLPVMNSTKIFLV